MLPGAHRGALARACTCSAGDGMGCVYVCGLMGGWGGAQDAGEVNI